MKKITTQFSGEMWLFWCPGCNTHHAFTTRLGTNQTGPVWKKIPNELTFSPSLLCNKNVTPEDIAHGMHRCHLFLRRGQVQYLSDCTHKLKGQTIPVQDPV